MEDTEYVDIEFDAKEKVTHHLSRMEKAVEHFGGVVERMSDRFMDLTSAFGGMGIAMSVEPAIEGANRYIERLDRISDLTGIAADKAGGIQNALTGLGVSAEGVDQVFNRIVKKTAQTGEGNKALIKMAKRYGVAIKDGPEATLLAVSALMEKGKLNAGQMQRILGVSSDNAAELADALSKGPGQLGQMIADATKKNEAFSEEAMQGMKRFHNATARIHTAWDRFTASIMIRLAPVLEKLVSKFEGSIDGWAEGAKKFGEYLTTHMDELIKKAKIFAKVMLAQSLLQKFTGKGLAEHAQGLLGKGMSVGKGLMKGVEAFKSGGFKGVMELVQNLVSGIFKIKPIAELLLRFGPLAAVFGAAFAIFKAWGANVGGIVDKLKGTFGKIWDNLKGIGNSIAKLFSSDSGLGRFVEFLGTVFLHAIQDLAEAFNAILYVVNKIIDAVPDFAWTGVAGMAWNALTGPNEYDEAAKRGIERQRKNAPKPTVPEKGAKGAEVYQDFRGSRFDITQAFSDGYDPDRVAVAFSNDIAALGEKKVQSGFAPVFGVR